MENKDLRFIVNATWTKELIKAFFVYAIHLLTAAKSCIWKIPQTNRGVTIVERNFIN